MNLNKEILITAVVTMFFGLGMGYIIFGDRQVSSSSDQQKIDFQTTSDSSAKLKTWTCSMHPQIRQNEPGQCPICGMDLIELDEMDSSSPLILEMTNQAVKLANIQTSIIGEGGEMLSRKFPLSGKIQPDERLSSSQVAHVPGRIEKLFVSFVGESVLKGQKLATVYSPELITAQRELLEAGKLEQVNPELLKAARAKLRSWKIDEAIIREIEQDRTIRESFALYTDESGVVTERLVSVGDYVDRGQPMFELMNLRKVWALFDVYEEDVRYISVGDRIEFFTPSLPDQKFRSAVTFIDPIINKETRTAAVRIEVNNSAGLLKPEMLVYGSLERKSKSAGQIVVPKSAIMWTGVRSVVYVKIPNVEIPSFEYREVELGPELGDVIQIISGLRAGEEVVTYGSFVIDAAAQLNNQSSMINRRVSVEKKGQSESLPDHTEATPRTFKEQLYAMARSYLALKDALVSTNEVKAKEAASQLLISLSDTDMTLIEGEAHKFWMDLNQAIKDHSNGIMKAPGIDEQRRQFDFLSQAMIRSVKVFGVGDSILYVQHCPMTNENAGADWLSNERMIRNPYYGDKMLTCGLIKDSISNSRTGPSK